MIVPIVIVIVCILSLLLLQKKSEKKSKNEKEGQMVSAQDFLNTKDIINHVLYTKDGYCISYIQLQPPMSSLWSRREKRMRTNTIVSEISKDRFPWKLTGVSRPLDISQLINQYRQLREDTDSPIRKNILKQEMQNLQMKVGAGEAVERQFYIQYWMEEKEGVEVELLERARQIISAYEAIGVYAHLLDKPEIIRFCNLIHNPTYINVEDLDINPSMPIINE